jgi:hypothetical protein
VAIGEDAGRPEPIVQDVDAPVSVTAHGGASLPGPSRPIRPTFPDSLPGKLRPKYDRWLFRA